MPKVAKKQVAAARRRSTAPKKYTLAGSVRAREEGGTAEVRRDRRPRGAARRESHATPIRWCAAPSSCPHGTGQTLRVLVFAKGEKAKEAEAAGADFVGEADLVDQGPRRLHGLRPRDRHARHDGRWSVSSAVSSARAA